MRRALAAPQRVHVLHHRRDRSVVTERWRVLADLLDRRRQLAQHLGVRRPGGVAVAHRGPQPVEEPLHAADPRIAEVAPFLERAEEHQVGTERIRAPLLDVLVGVHDVALRLGHLRAVTDDQSVGAELRERLLELEQSLVVEYHRDEARVEQVQHGVLISADVRRHRQPLLGDRLVERDVGARYARIAQEVPRAVEEGVAHVGLAARLLPAGGARNAIPLLVARERRDTRVVGLEIGDVGQHHRQLRFRHRHRAAGVAVDDRDRRAPIALT